MMRAAVASVVWIRRTVSSFVDGELLACSASSFSLFIMSIKRERSTDGGGMLVGRTVGGDVGVEDVKLSGDGTEGLGLGVACCGAFGAGPSEKSPQSSNSSSQSGSLGGVVIFLEAAGFLVFGLAFNAGFGVGFCVDFVVAFGAVGS